jgi:ribonuclease P protein component
LEDIRIFSSLLCRDILQRIVTKAQFAAVMSGQTVSRTPHFALHRVALQPNAESKSAPRAVVNPVVSNAAMVSADASQTLSKPLFAVQDTWLGVIVPKRWAKRAVTRNTIKRQIYAVSTDAGCAMPVAAHVVRLRAGFDRAEFISATSDKLKIAVRAELQHLFAGAKL